MSPVYFEKQTDPRDPKLEPTSIHQIIGPSRARSSRHKTTRSRFRALEFPANTNTSSTVVNPAARGSPPQSKHPPGGAAFPQCVTPTAGDLSSREEDTGAIDCVIRRRGGAGLHPFRPDGNRARASGGARTRLRGDDAASSAPRRAGKGRRHASGRQGVTPRRRTISSPILARRRNDSRRADGRPDGTDQV